MTIDLATQVYIAFGSYMNVNILVDTNGRTGLFIERKVLSS